MGTAVSQPRPSNVTPKARGPHFIVDSAQIFEKRHSRRFTDTARNSTAMGRQEIQRLDPYKLLFIHINNKYFEIPNK
jgi:hypothetical protein